MTRPPSRLPPVGDGSQVLAVFRLGADDLARLERVDDELGAATGRLFRFQARSADASWLVELWRSEDELDRHAERLVPALIGAGIEPPAPRLYRVQSTRLAGSGS